MQTQSNFSPNWAIPPGTTIQEILNERNIDLNLFASRINQSIKSTTELLDGKLSIDTTLANSLSEVLGASPNFWKSREKNYRASINRIKAVKEEEKQWLSKIPVRDMINNNWIKVRDRRFESKLEACLDFFNVQSVSEWYKSYEDKILMTSFRTSETFHSTPESVITWLRRGEELCLKENIKPWNRLDFHKSLFAARDLTTCKTPSTFIPKLKEIFSESGVHLVVSKTPAGCRASGATFFSKQGRAVILLSFRHLSDDHFWFTLFHEAGHLVLHGDKSLFLEGKELSSTKEEAEANNFSMDILVPKENQAELKCLSMRNWRQIPRFAKKVGTSTGIIVGQLQNSGQLRHNQLNKFKIRYDWKDIYS